jgi:CelD/BcsL family acetyltransferase involved in cellulose biosynthesis
MSLTTRQVQSLEALGAAAWTELAARCRTASVFQSFAWLSAWWATWGVGSQVILLIEENGQLVGAAALYRDEERTLRFIGEEHADYGDVLAVSDRADVIAALIDSLFAQASAWRRLILDAVRSESALALELRRRGFLQGEAIPCPRAQFAQRPARQLCAKSSLKRHVKGLAQLGAVQSLHLDTAAAILPWLEEFFQQHIERWAFTSTPSLFLNPRNVAFYRELAASAAQGGEILFSALLLEGKPVAMHFGFRSERQLLWYKATFDPRLKSHSPGEVLLSELLRHADLEQLQGLDFTRGAEAFKLRFASETRFVSAMEVWSPGLVTVSTKGRSLLRRGMIRALDAVRLRASAAAGLRRVARALAVWRRQGAYAVVRRAHRLWVSSRRVPVHLYAHARSGSVTEVPDQNLLKVTTVAELLECFDARESQCRYLFETAASRLAGGDQLMVRRAGAVPVAYAWATSKSPLPLTELSATLEFRADTVVLYDCQVFPAYRRQGHYKALLETVRGACAASWVAVYARADNLASCAGIKNANFTHYATLRRRGGAVQCLTLLAGGPQLTLLPEPRGAA